MDKFKRFLKMDLWVMLLDMIAVNASYYFALLVRFYVNSEFRPSVGYYHGYFLRIAPFYTVVAILIFLACRLYGGMWTAAGLNDMNRILIANALTIIAQVVISLLVGLGIPQASRMPYSYYTIGAFTQFFLIVLIRFSHRFITMEKTKIARGKMDTIPVLVVGSGSLGRKVVRHLEDNTPYRAVIIAGKDSGRTMDGISVVDLDDISNQIKTKDIKAVFIADKDLGKAQRDAITEAAEGIEVQDFTGQLTNMTGFVPLSALMEIIDTPLTVEADGVEERFSNGMECLHSLDGEYKVLSVNATRIVIRKAENDDSWMKVNMDQSGSDVSFF